MKSFVKTLIFLSVFSVLSAEVITINAKEALNDESLQIFDIRTIDEWKNGVLENATLIEFVRNDGSINADFFEQIKASLKPGKIPALICRSGNRSKRAAEFLELHHSKELGGKIINLDKGMKSLINNGVKTIKPNL